MDHQDYNTFENERKRGQHLTYADRGAIQHLHKLGYSNRAIARDLNCSPTTIGNELSRGTPPRKCKRGRPPEYSAKRGQGAYSSNKSRCHKQYRVNICRNFVDWTAKQVREHKWSLDACVGYARLHKLFPKAEMVCTRTLYNALWNGILPITLFEVPVALKRRKNKQHVSIRRQPRGRSIDERPLLVAGELGHWEGDTVIGRKKGREAVVLTLVEKVSDNYIALRIPNKTKESVNAAMRELKHYFGDAFSSVFKSITVDNGSEFDAFAENEKFGTTVYYAHPYSSWERPQNERHNGLFRDFVPKGVSIEKYSAEDILAFADELNGRPRKRLAYATPEEIFDAFLDSVYAVR